MRSYFNYTRVKQLPRMQNVGFVSNKQRQCKMIDTENVWDNIAYNLVSKIEKFFKSNFFLHK